MKGTNISAHDEKKLNIRRVRKKGEGRKERGVREER